MILNRNFQLASDMFETVSHNQHIRLALDYQYITHSFLAISSNHHYTFGKVENQIVTKEVVIAGFRSNREMALDVFLLQSFKRGEFQQSPPRRKEY